MRTLALVLLALAPLLLVIGCGGTQSLRNADRHPTEGPATSDSGADAPLSVSSCGLTELSFGGGCVPISGSTWLLTTHMPEGTRTFEIDFHPGGRCTSHDPADSTPDDDEWAIEAKGLRFWFNHRYVVYEVELDGPRAMHGITHNVNDLSWAWSAVRVR